MLMLLDPVSYDPHSSKLGGSSFRWLLVSPLPLLTIGVMVGVGAEDLFKPASHWGWCLPPVLLAATAYVLAGVSAWQRFTLLLLGFVVGVGAAAMHADLRQPSLEPLTGAAVIRIDDSVRVDAEGNRRTTVILEAFGDPDAEMVPVGQRYRVRLPAEAPTVVRGDRLVVRARPEGPRPRLFPGAPNYQRSVAASGAVGTLRLRGPWLTLGAEPSLLATLDRQRHRAHELLVGHSPGGVLPALALGQGGAVLPEIRELYGRCGLAHVLAVSGLHFGLVALLVFGLARKVAGRSVWIARRWGATRVAVLVALPMLLAYVAYVGAPVSARRACIMALCLLVGHAVHREGHPVISLSAAALIILLIQPAELFSAGFQLSFSAVLGLLWTAENYEKPIRERISDRFGRRGRPLEWIASSLIATIGASVTTLPFVLYHFGQVPLAGMVANIWVVPVVSFVLLPLALASALLVDLWPALAELLAQLGGTCEGWLTWSVAGFDALIPLVAVDSSQAIPAWLLATYGLGSISWLLAPSHGWARFLALPMLLVVFAMHVGLAVAPPHQETLRVTFVSIGQGDATLIEFPDGQTMLIDAGGVPGSDYDTGARVVMPFLRATGHPTVDIVVLTHPDFDHMGGLASVIRGAKPSQVWVNGDELDSEAWYEVEDAIAEVGATSRVVDASASPMDFGGVELRVLWPDRFEGKRNRNDNSVVIRLDYGYASFILPGDAEVEAERGMLASGAPLGATVLKSGHHGSRTSSSAAMLDVVQPELLIHSVGEGNKFGFPHPEVIRRAVARGIRSYRTDRDGTVRIETDGHRLVVETWRQ